MPTPGSGDATSVLAGLGRQMAELDSGRHVDVVERLEQPRRLVGTLDTKRQQIERIKIGDTSVFGPMAWRQYAHIRQVEEQLWQVIVEGNAEPKRSHRLSVPPRWRDAAAPPRREARQPPASR